MIAYRRMSGSGVLGASMLVIMRYTLRLLTLDQLSRAAGVVCALELLRDDPRLPRRKGQPRVAARRLADRDWSVGRLRRLAEPARRQRPNRRRHRRRPCSRVQGRQVEARTRPDQGLPMVRHRIHDPAVPLHAQRRQTNLEIRCANVKCEFTGNRALPMLTVDQPIYRRLPAFLIATIDKFAFAAVGGRAEPSSVTSIGSIPPSASSERRKPAGTPLDNGHKLDPPDLIIQDELHLISGPLGTVAGLYETAIDALAQRRIGENIVRPQVGRLDRDGPPGRGANTITSEPQSNRRVSTAPRHRPRRQFLCRTLTPAQSPARLYLGVAAQGRGPKLVFLQLVTGARGGRERASTRHRCRRIGRDGRSLHDGALLLNALRELGGARRIVEDEVRDRVP